jgi:hypothetical protein
VVLGAASFGVLWAAWVGDQGWAVRGMPE